MASTDNIVGQVRKGVLFGPGPGVGPVEVAPNLITAECERITPQLLPLVQLSQEEIDRVVASVPGGVRNVQDIYPLAPLQEGILFHHLMSQHGDPYVLWTLRSFSDRGKLDAYVGALNAVIARHDILRTGVMWEGLSEPVQVVWRHAVLQVEELVLEPDAGDVTEQLRERFSRRCRVEVRRAPMMRLYVARDPARQRWVGVQLCHHLVSDQATVDVMNVEVQAYLEGQAGQLPQVRPYRQFVAHMLQRVARGEHEAFFRQMLGDVEEPTVPFGLLEVHGDGEGIVEARCKLKPLLSRRIRKCARVQGVSAASVFHVAWGQVLARASGRDEPVFGTVVFGQMYGSEGAERMMGPFINTLPVRIRLSKVSVERCVRETHRQLAQMLRYAHAPLAAVQRYSQVPAGVPLFTALLNYRHSASAEGGPGAWSGVAPQEGFLAAGEAHTHYALLLSVDDWGQDFGLTAQVDSAVGAERLCAMMQSTLEQVVSALESRPAERISELEVLPVEERKQLLVQWNETGESYSSGCIHELFDAQAVRTPEALAVVYEGKHLTYAELAVRSNQLAHHLRSCGVGPEVVVGLCAERSLEMVVGLLGILKAGGAYLPLDPQYPAERLDYMLEDAGVQLVLTQRQLAERVPIRAAQQLLQLDGQCEQITRQPTSAPVTTVTAQNLAYVIYTSGSTGKPKGVMVEHRNLVSSTLARWSVYGEPGRFLLVSPFGFDSSIAGFFGTLTRAGTLLIATERMTRDVQLLTGAIERLEATSLLCVPALYRAILDARSVSEASSTLTRVTVAGEACPPTLVAESARAAPGRVIFNEYGPTEATVWATVFKCSNEHPMPSVPIGKPIANTQIYILDSRRLLVPIGVAGELHIGGAGIARGYLNRPGLTAQCFVADPYGEPGSRVYRSGDVVRYRADGNLEFVGRRDQQVKIRGYRIELGEIESALLSHPGVKQAVVVAREEVAGEKQLVGYITAEGGDAPGVSELRKHLHRGLPDYMVPSALVVLEQLPLTSHGKVDRRSLPAPQGTSYVRGGYEAPQGVVEEILARLWGELLHITQVSRHDNFFELGGHSILIVRLLAKMRNHGLHADVPATFTARTLQELAQRVSTDGSAVAIPANGIPPECEHIEPQMLTLASLDPQQIACLVQQVPGGAGNVQDVYPLTSLQEGLFFHHLMQQQGDAYLLIQLLQFATRERLDEFLRALQAVIDRHDALRTAVVWEGLPAPHQVVWRRAVLPVEEVLVHGADEAEQLQERFTPRRYRLDLRRAPLIAAFVAPEASTGRWLLYLLSHHLVIDHTTREIVLQELQAHLAGEQGRLPEPLPYRNFVARVRRGVSEQEHKEFFRQMLSAVQEPTTPFDRLDVQGDGSGVTEVSEALEASLSQQLREQARALGVSAASVCHLAWARVLGRMCARDDVVFGTVLWGRILADEQTRSTLGLFINTLPVRIELSGRSVREAVQETHERLGQLLHHEHASLSLAQRCSGVSAPTPLFNTVLNYRHSLTQPVQDVSSRRAWRGIRMLHQEERTNFPLIMTIDDLGEGFTLTVQAAVGLEAARICGYMRRGLQEIVRALRSTPQEPVRLIEVLSEGERQQLLVQWNETRQSYPSECIHELFDAQAVRTPEAVAVVSEDEHLSYAELAVRSNQLAHHLRSCGVGPEVVVGLCVERSLELVVGLLGILKAGGAYVPMDPRYPRDRLAYMLADSRPKLVISQTSLESMLPDASIPRVMLDEQGSGIAAYPQSNPDYTTRTSRQLAYVIYTSGSTGRPKGVMIEHASVVNFMDSMRTAPGISPEDVLLGITSLSFDIAALEILLPLLNGACVVLAAREDTVSGERLMALIESWQVSIMQATPSTWRMLTEQPQWPAQRRPLKVLCGGEALPTTLAERLLSRVPQVWNLYGPTETTIWSTLRCLTEPRPDIGRPIANTGVYILDGWLRPVPVGVSGQIHIGGAGVARGYLNRPELTAERFINDPFSSDPQARMYKTGDLGRWHADGKIEYLGRNDSQVKIRGFRIELGEIEARLLQHPQVKEAAVLARENESGEKSLVAYVVGQQAADTDTALSLEILRAHLKPVLPEYMVPSAFVMLERLPLTANGKLDRRALPAPERGAYGSGEYEAPQGEIEEILAGIWQALLRVEHVGRHDNFFGLGGHSLLIVRMLERLRRVGLSVEVRRVFDTPTLAELASVLGHGTLEEFVVPANLIPPGCEAITPQMLPLVELEAEHIERIVQAVPGGAANVQDIYPLAPLQEGLLFHHLLERDKDVYARAMLLSLASRERVEKLVAALQAVIDRHDILRTVVLWEQLPQPVQVVYRRALLQVEEITLDPESDPIEQFKERMRPERQRLDLRQAPLLRLQVAVDSRGQWHALLQTHHLVCDDVSVGILHAEVIEHLQGSEKELPEPVAYRNHVAQALASARAQDAESFFRGKLGDVEEPTAPFGLLDVHGDGSQAEAARQDIELEISQRVRVQARRLSVSAATVFHAAWALVVAHTSGRDDVVFGTVLLGRLQGSAGAQRILGVFINTLPLRVPLREVTAKGLVERTQREVVELLGHEQSSLGLAQRCSGVVASTPLFSSLLNYRHGRSNSEISWSQSGATLLAGVGGTNYPIAVSVDDLGEGFAVTAHTDRRIDPRRIVQYVCAAVHSLVEALESAPQTPALSLSILPESERRQVLELFNATEAVYPSRKLIHELFEEQVQRTPSAVAVVYEGHSLTYAELNAKANQLAWYLREQGVTPGELIPILMPRSLQMLIAELAVLKIGAAYVPVDPQFPLERQAFILRDCAAQRVLTAQERRAEPDAGKLQRIDCRWIDCDATAEAMGTFRRENPGLKLSTPAVAYVMYTSGSTGEPKGVVVPHHAVNRLVINNGYMQVEPGDCFAHCSNPAFDASTFEVWGALLNGARVAIIPQAVVLDLRNFAQTLQRHRVTVLWLTAGLFTESVPALVAVSSQLRYLLVGGDVVNPEAVRQMLRGAPPRHLLNGYGPTEGTTFSTTYALETLSEAAPSIPIGRPIANTQVYVLDACLNPVPIGVTGELYIGGAGVALGYLNRPELTAERFIKDPFSSDPQARLYRTGDLGRWRADGNIEYLGRNDSQVKIRGFRIELGEIEAQLLQYPQVKEAVVLARENESGEKRLVAYVVGQRAADADNAISVETLRAHLKPVLPEYMVPSAFVMLERLPLTANGKLDRRALPAPGRGAYGSGEYEAPQGEIEEILAVIWQALLRVERVGRHDTFFGLGGHSLLMVQMLERLRRVGLSVQVREVFDAPTLAELASVVGHGTLEEFVVPANLIPPGCEAITPQMLPLVELEAEHIERIVQAVPGGAANVQDIYPLAPLQEGILFHHLLEQDKDVYARAMLLSLTSQERVEKLVAALQAVIDRHDILRTAVLWEQLPQPVQVVYRRAVLQVEETTLDRDRDPVEQLKERMRPERQRLDLRQAPLLRLQVAADSRGGQWHALLQTHHLVCDEVSVAILLSEVIDHLQDCEKEFPQPIAYRNHVAQALASARAQDAESFFRGKLGDVEEPTSPFGLLDVHGDGSQTEAARQDIELEISKRVRVQARRLSVSAATLFHAAWALVVAHTSGRDDVVFGTVLLGRLQGSAGAQRILGMFINTLPLRVPLREVTAKGLVERTQREVVELLGHEQSSLALAQRCSGVAASTPLFSSLLNYRHGNSNSGISWSQSGATLMASAGGTNYPITISVDDQGEGFSVTAETDRRIDPRRIVQYVCAVVHSLVEALESAPQTPALSLSILPESERRQVLELFNATEAAYPREKLIHELFEEQVHRTPSAVAVVYEDEHLSYAELAVRSNQLAHHLRSCGVGPEVVVGLCVERSLEMVVGLLGILKAGGVYLPLDPQYPAERLGYMLEDAGVQWVLTQSQLAERVPVRAGQQLLQLDGQCESITRQPTSAPVTTVTAQNLAYVIYTSGSTGQPKGVMVEHRNVLSLWQGIENVCYQSVAGPRIALNASLNFDASVKQFVQLLSGRTLVVVPEQYRRDPSMLLRFLSESQIHGVDCTPSQLKTWISAGLLEADGYPLQRVLVGGEAIDSELWDSLANCSAIDFYNVYGPTECTVDSTVASLRGDTTAPHIGHPMANRPIYILDCHYQPVPIGVTGEIYIGGVGVARGYLNRPELTAERFIRDPFSSDPQARLYKTGDLGRWRADGNIEYLGRNDSQVKIRGFRIELGEIEAQLLRYPQVKEAVVLAREDESGQKHLVAYVVGQQAADTDDALCMEILRAHLKPVLPEYMLPSAFVMLESLPLTANGKLDRRALPAPERGAYGSRKYEAPQGEIEEILAVIWQALLRVERVGRHDTFFGLGGHSLLIVQMLERLRRVGLSAQVREVFDAPTLAELASVLGHGTLEEFVVPANLIPPDCEVITPRMLPLVELEAEHIERIVQAVPGGVANVQDIYPLAPLQEGILFHHLLGQDKDVYARAMLLSLASQERVEKLVAALQAVIDRHDILRTAVLWEQLPQPVQVVYRRAVLQVEEITLDRDCDPIEQFKERMRPERQRLDLRQAPLLRLQVAADSRRGQWHALLQTHHLVCDDVSVAILLSEVIDHLQDCEKEFPKPVAYRNHVAQALAFARAQDAESFFRGKLGDVEEPTAPFGLLDVHGDGSQVEAAHQDIELDISKRVRVQARRLSVSAATLFHAAWALVAAHTSGRDDVVFGTVLLGRLQGSAGAQRILGMFINTLPLRVPLREVTAKGLVERTQREVVELLGHEQSSLALAQRCSGVAASTPLFSSLLNYRHGESNSGISWSQSGATLMASAGGTNYPITISVDDQGEGFSVTAETDRRIDPRRMVQYVCTAVQSLVEALERAPQTPALSLSILPESERRQVLELFNATEAVYPREKLIHELFEGQVQRAPGAVAVVYEGHSLTYAELNAKANQLAHYLRERQIGPDELVGICLERSLEMVVGLLGIFKAGGAYVPLDPSYPPERLAYMLRDAAPRVLLTQQYLTERLPSGEAEMVALDEQWSEIAQRPCEDLDSAALGLRSHHLAYVIYTSGSTGQPKGVMVEHRNVLNLWQGIENVCYQSFACQSIALNASLSFDASVQQFVQLLSGRTLFVIPEQYRRDPSMLLRFLTESQIHAVDCTPSQLKTWISAGLLEADGYPLQRVLVGGEAIDSELWDSLANCSAIDFYNVYGPTECTVDSTVASLRGDTTAPHIGHPMANRPIYILDCHYQPVPIGVTGEIYIGGVGVARGYLNRPELTAERFIKDPFSSDRMYRTGDLGRWRADGNIEYLGRNDGQVKIRGFRIELGEIEAQLLQYPQVKEAVVLAREDESGEKRLVGYVVSRESADTGNALSVEGLRAHLKPVLPEYMVPSAFVMLESLPLTPNGKLDRRALPAPERGTYLSQQYEAPQGEIEERLAEIWRKLLHRERVGRHDNFFELGGHSLHALKLIMKIKERFTVDLSPITVFRNPTVQQLAGTVRSTSSVPVATLVRGVREKGVKPSVKNGLLHLQIPRGALSANEIRALESSQNDTIAMLDRSSAAGVAPTPVPRLPAELIPLSLTQALTWVSGRTYHRATTMVRRIRGELNLELLDKSVQRLIQRHDALRIRIITVGGAPVQQVSDSHHERLQIEDLTSIPESNLDDEIQRRISQCLLERFDAARDPLCMFKLLKVNNREHVLIVATEHMISDGVSLGILWRDLCAMYVSELRGVRDELPEIPVQFPDYAVWQIKAHSVWMEQHGAAWVARMNGCLPVRLPTAQDPATAPRQGGGGVPIRIEPALKREWEIWCKRRQTTLPLSALTAYAAVLLRWCEVPEVVIQFVTTGRSSPKLENTVGYFAATLYVRAQSRDGGTLEDLLQCVVDDYSKSYDISDFCYLGAQVPRPEFSKTPLFNWLPPDVETNQASVEADAVSLTSESIAFRNSFFEQASGDSDPHILFRETRDEINGQMAFPLNLFSEGAMERFVRHFLTILRTILTTPEVCVKDVPLV